jgi:colicin import membrane protein
MSDTAPYIVLKEARNWKATILAIAVHVLLLGALWAGARHQDAGLAPSKAENQSTERQGAAAKAESASSFAAASAPQVAAKQAMPAVSAASPVSKPNSQPNQRKAIAADFQPKRAEPAVLEQNNRTRQRRLAILKRKESDKRIEKQKRQEAAQAIARQQKKQKLETLAHQTKKKKTNEKEKEQREALAKRHAAQARMKATAQAKRQKEQAEARLIEKTRQDEMRRITSAIAKPDRSGSS